MPQKLIVFAQKQEAEASLRILNATPIDNYAYAFEGGVIAISGMGLCSALFTTSQYAHQVDEVWNLGLAGALHNALTIGTLLEIKTIGKYLPLCDLDPHSLEIVKTATPQLLLAEGGGKLITSDFPIHEQIHRHRLAKKWDIVDMEGYAVAYTALRLGKKCRMWKIISDFASPGGRELIEKNKAHLSQLLAKTIHEKLYESCSYP